MNSTPITSARLTLEPLTVEHADEMVAVLSDTSLYTFTGGEPPLLDLLRERYRLQIIGSPEPGEWLNWIIRQTADELAVGFFQADVIGDTAELAWVVAPEHQGQGLATEGATAIQNRLASTGVRSFSACIHPAHAASQAVAQHIGLTNTFALDDEGEHLWSSNS